MKNLKTPVKLEELKAIIARDEKDDKKIISVCSGTGCNVSGANTLIDALKEKLNRENLNDKVEIKATGCHGFCEQGPVVVIKPENIFYRQVTAEDAQRIIESSIKNNEILEDLLYQDPVTGKKIVYEEEIPFYKKQYRLLFKDNGNINPHQIEDYLAVGGYSSLIKVLEKMSEYEVIEEVKKSHLRGRGGAGFPAGVKWESCYNASEDIKYVICNTDEGDPGCFQDRSLTEGNPHLILEGMIIGAYAVGANIGYIYIRNEYPLAIKSFNIAISQAKKYGLLGENILGTGFDFDVKISRGGGAFVCGESSALIESIEGKVGEPQQRSIRSTEKGLWDKPTLLNNVKTWATIPLIINKGANWFTKIGTDSSKGTMIFSLTGKVKNTGLVEVPMGITLKELVFDIGGGITEDKKIKAVQTGGPSGGCIPEHLLDLPVDYDKLAEAGSMMGSGGLIVMDETTCMVDVAKYFLSFNLDESCGRCFSCREGISRMLEITEDITRGDSSLEQLELLKELALMVKDASLCGLGQTAPNPVLSTIRYFETEYRSHILENKCPAGVCHNLISFSIDENLCNGCGLCLKKCPSGAIWGDKKEPHVILQDKCDKCGICLEVCKYDAVIKK